MEERLPFGSPEYLLFLSIAFFSRGMDFLSTWIATPNMVLEGNPLAKKMGWKWGVAVNVFFCFAFAFWPLTTVIIATTSLLVAARNFQQAWLMRSMGEQQYRDWFVEQLHQTSLPLYLFCLLAQTGLTAGIGFALALSNDLLIPVGVGVGVIGYALTVLVYTALSLWRIRRAMS